MTINPLWDGFAYKPHQIAGIEWMQQRPSGGVLCDEMGLGKTIQMLGLLKSEARTNTLLIAPVAVLNQWAELARKSKITVLRHKITNRHMSWEIEGSYRLAAPKLYLIGYEMARSKHQLVTMMAWDRLICDEAHRCASGNGLTKLIDLISAKQKWFLTATPIVNKLEDLTTLLGLVGADVKGFANNLNSLEPLIKKYVLARSMDDLRATIPDAPPTPEIQTETLPFLTPEEHEFYTGMSGAIVKRWKALEADSGGARGLMRLQLFMRLRQLSVHPQVYIDARKKALGHLGYTRPDWEGPATKFETIKRLTKESPNKWIVFCHFHPEMELMKETLKTLPWIRNVYTYNGSMSHNERTNVLEATKDPLPEGSLQSDILMIQLQSGGVGLNLQHFNRIIFSGPWWTSALMEQAIGRAVRIGQRDVVKVYHLRLKEEENINIDKVMMEKASEKGDLCKTALKLASRDLGARV
jgi:SNF2 family DNA or RNA helicase